MFIPSKDHIRHIIQYEFHKGFDERAAAKSMQVAYGNNAVNEKVAGDFPVSDVGIFSLKDEQKEGRPKKKISFRRV